MRYLLVKNWAEFQHYKDRLPPWIKLHRALLTDYEFCHLPDETKCHLMMAWLLASQMDGRLPDDAKWIAARIGANKPVNIDLLVQGGWLIREHVASEPASTALAERKQSAIVETETYKATETETENPRGREDDALAAWVPKAAWADFVAYRKTQKGWTSRAGVLLLRELDRLRRSGHDPTAVLEQSIANGWKGLFALRGEREMSRAEKRARNIDILTGKTRDERAIEGVAERVGGAVVLPLSSDLREQGRDDVGRLGHGGSAAGVG